MSKNRKRNLREAAGKVLNLSFQCCPLSNLPEEQLIRDNHSMLLCPEEVGSTHTLRGRVV